MHKSNAWLLFFGGILAATVFGVGLAAVFVWGVSEITADNGGLTYLTTMQPTTDGYEGAGEVQRELGKFAPVLIMSEQLFEQLQKSEAKARFSVRQGGRVVLDDELPCEQMVYSPSFRTAFMPQQSAVRLGSDAAGELRATICGVPTGMAGEGIELGAFRYGWK